MLVRVPKRRVRLALRVTRFQVQTLVPQLDVNHTNFGAVQFFQKLFQDLGAFVTGNAADACVAGFRGAQYIVLPVQFRRRVRRRTHFPGKLLGGFAEADHRLGGVRVWVRQSEHDRLMVVLSDVMHELRISAKFRRHSRNAYGFTEDRLHLPQSTYLAGNRCARKRVSHFSQQAFRGGSACQPALLAGLRLRRVSGRTHLISGFIGAIVSQFDYSPANIALHEILNAGLCVPVGKRLAERARKKYGGRHPRLCLLFAVLFEEGKDAAQAPLSQFDIYVVAHTSMQVEKDWLLARGNCCPGEWRQKQGAQSQ